MTKGVLVPFSATDESATTESLVKLTKLRVVLRPSQCDDCNVLALRDPGLGAEV